MGNGNELPQALKEMTATELMLARGEVAPTYRHRPATGALSQTGPAPGKTWHNTHIFRGGTQGSAPS